MFYLVVGILGVTILVHILLENHYRTYYFPNYNLLFFSPVHLLTPFILRSRQVLLRYVWLSGSIIMLSISFFAAPVYFLYFEFLIGFRMGLDLFAIISRYKVKIRQVGIL